MKNPTAAPGSPERQGFLSGLARRMSRWLPGGRKGDKGPALQAQTQDGTVDTSGMPWTGPPPK
jgi:hypothetical protein